MYDSCNIRKAPVDESTSRQLTQNTSRFTMTTTTTTTISSPATTTMAAERASKISSYRSLVPLVNELGVTYLNSSFAPPVNTIVHSAITKHLSEGLYTPRPKATWQSRAEETRGLLARYINAPSPSSIAFTRDTTEGLNHFIRSLPFTPGDNVLVLSSEHPNHAYAWLALRALGLEVRVIDPSADTTCFASAATFLPHVDARTRAVGLSHAMFHSGQLNDAAAISAALRPRGVDVLLDMTQSVGFLGRARVDVRALGVSAAAFSLHKGLGCPTGLAGLYVDPAALATLAPVPPCVGAGAVANLRADLVADGEREVVWREGAGRFEHLNLSLVAADAASAWLAFYLDTMGPEEVESHLYALGDVLREECAGLGVEIVGPRERERHSPHCYVLRLFDARWKDFLEEKGVIVQHYRLGVRVSFAFYNNLDDVRRLAEVLRLGKDAGIPLE